MLSIPEDRKKARDKKRSDHLIAKTVRINCGQFKQLSGQTPSRDGFAVPGSGSRRPLGAA
jgi:hypothetical protein